MAFLVLGLASRRPVQIDDGAIATSFPDFVALTNRLGGDIADADDPPARRAGRFVWRSTGRRPRVRAPWRGRSPSASVGLSDTGALYRATAFLVLQAQGDPVNPERRRRPPAGLGAICLPTRSCTPAQ